jgi:16S rRNA (adenine1518-N6/adenine1519-N6)-dimethyltransferase
MKAPSSRRPIKDTLRGHDVQPSKALGQNFLSDPEAARWIVDQLDIQPHDTVLEIGPGLGALTQFLTGRGRALHLLEKDARLAERLRTELGAQCASIDQADAVEADLRPYFKLQPLKVIGALPYSCGTEIVRTFLRTPSPVGRAVFVLQKEVCERICAVPHSPHRGLLSVRIQSRWEPRLLRTLPPDIFVPRPKVDSAVMSLTPRPRAQLPPFDEAVLDRLLRMGFSQRRKMLRKLLPAAPLPWEDLAASLGFPATARAEELTLAQWVALANIHDTHHIKHAQSGDEIFDVVDENDCVLERRPRREVHALGLRHRAVHVFAFNDRGELILQKRSHLKDAQPEKWDSTAAGHLDAGEGYLCAAVRELEEEAGVVASADSLQRIARIPACAATGWEWVELFAVRTGARMRFPCSEIECMAAFSLTEIAEWIALRPEDFAEGFIVCFRAWQQHTIGR